MKEYLRFYNLVVLKMTNLVETYCHNGMKN